MKSWHVCILVMLILFVVIWIFYGRGNYEFIGLREQRVEELNNEEGEEEELDRQEEQQSIEESIEEHEDIQCSKGEKICRQVLESIYGKKFPRVRPDFLRNPDTNRNLELDCFNQELKIAVEYNGISHYRHPNHLNMTEEEFLYGVKKDQMKVEMCDKNGVYLLTIPYTIKHHQIRDYIIRHLPR
jgi:hypothetical protein